MAAEYPLPKFHFQVNWGGEAELRFTEVSGLDYETEVIEYRGGNDKAYHKTKQPGLTKYANITLKKGMFLNNVKFFEEWKKTFMYQEQNATYRVDLVIQLLNEKSEPIMTWKAVKAWPSKIQSTDLKADANEVAIETMELVHEGLTQEANSS